MCTGSTGLIFKVVFCHICTYMWMYFTRAYQYTLREFSCKTHAHSMLIKTTKIVLHMCTCLMRATYVHRAKHTQQCVDMYCADVYLNAYTRISLYPCLCASVLIRSNIEGTQTSQTAQSSVPQCICTHT